MTREIIMRRNTVAVLAVICAVALTAGSGRALAQDKPLDPSSIEFRSQFIENFKHIMLDSAAEDAMFLRILIDAMDARRGIEVGVARGFGAVNMGIAFERTGGHLYGVDISRSMCTKARANLKTVALDTVVTVIEGDALKVLPKLEGKYDFVFLDALKRDYFKYFKFVEDKLVDGAVVTADNTIGSARAMRDFLDYVFESEKYDAVTIRASMAKNDGITLVYKVPAGKVSPGPVKTAVREKQLKALAAAKDANATVIDATLLRILAESTGAKHGLARCSDNGGAAVSLGMAFERTGGKLTVSAANPDAVGAAVKAAGLDKTVSVFGHLPEDAKSGPFDLLFLDDRPSEYLDLIKAIESHLAAGAVIIADNTLVGGKAKAFNDYLVKSPLYNAVTLRAADKGVTDGMTVAHKVWTPLFNGRDLDGWTIECKPADKGKGFWTVKDGAIACDSMDKGKHNYVWLMTKGEYGDFELKLKVRGHASKSRGNSGVQVRSRYDAKAGWLDGPQVDIHPPAPWRTGLIYDETREARRWIFPSLKNWSIKREQGPKQCRWQADGWNNLIIRCKGTKILTRLNGLTVTDFDGKGVLDDEAHRKHNVGLTGQIALQLHSGDKLLIEFKDIYIRPLR